MNKKAFYLRQEIFVSLRKDVLKEAFFPYQEVYLILDCFLKIKDKIYSMIELNETEIKDSLIHLYNHSYKEFMDKRFKVDNLYTLPCFPYVIQHLCEKHFLKKTVLHINTIIDSKKSEWANVTDNDLFMYFDNLYTEDDDVTDMWLHFMGLSQFLPNKPKYEIKWNKNKDFFTEDLYNRNIFGREDPFMYFYLGIYTHDGLDDYNPNDERFIGVTKHDDAMCIWPFKNGYARVLGKDGKWGYLSEESNLIHWLAGEVVYAEDFECERARIHLDCFSHIYQYIGLCLDDCFHKTFSDASDFKDGYALVSDQYCINYHIDVFGNVAKEDMERYENCKKEILEDEKKREERLRQKSIDSEYDYSDPETEIMKSLSGHGADPEIHGF